MNKKLLLMAGVLSIIGSTTMADEPQWQSRTWNVVPYDSRSSEQLYMKVEYINRYPQSFAYFKSNLDNFQIVDRHNNETTSIMAGSLSFYDNNSADHSHFSANSIVMEDRNGSFEVKPGWLRVNGQNSTGGDTVLDGRRFFAFDGNSSDERTVEFGLDKIDAGNQQIHNVTAGTDDTDAVNVKQLKDYVAANDKDTITTVKAGNNIEVTANGHDYTVSLKKDVVDKIDNATAGIKANADAIKSNADAVKSNTDAIKANTADIAVNKAQIDNLVNQIGNNDTKINNMINNTRQEARRGIASASALAALHPLDYNPDHKVDVMGGVGHYRGKTSVALGAAYRPNENLMFTVGTAINGKDSSVNAGVSYKVGAKDSTYKSQASLAKDVEDLKQIVAKLQAELEEARKK